VRGPSVVTAGDCGIFEIVLGLRRAPYAAEPQPKPRGVIRRGPVPGRDEARTYQTIW
jgi:hypothetical protein